jgi:hypothetical protein
MTLISTAKNASMEPLEKDFITNKIMPKEGERFKAEEC